MELEEIVKEDDELTRLKMIADKYLKEKDDKIIGDCVRSIVFSVNEMMVPYGGTNITDQLVIKYKRILANEIAKAIKKHDDLVALMKK